MALFEHVFLFFLYFLVYEVIEVSFHYFLGVEAFSLEPVGGARVVYGEDSHVEYETVDEQKVVYQEEDEDKGRVELLDLDAILPDEDEVAVDGQDRVDCRDRREKDLPHNSELCHFKTIYFSIIYSFLYSFLYTFLYDCLNLSGLNRFLVILSLSQFTAQFLIVKKKNFRSLLKLTV